MGEIGSDASVASVGKTLDEKGSEFIGEKGIDRTRGVDDASAESPPRKEAHPLRAGDVSLP